MKHVPARAYRKIQIMLATMIATRPSALIPQQQLRELSKLLRRYKLSMADMGMTRNTSQVS